MPTQLSPEAEAKEFVSNVVASGTGDSCNYGHIVAARVAKFMNTAQRVYLRHVLCAFVCGPAPAKIPRLNLFAPRDPLLGVKQRSVGVQSRIDATTIVWSMLPEIER